MPELYLEDFSAGQRFESGRHLIDEDQIHRFAHEFDPQPFHLDDAIARGTLFGGLAASGWHTAAITMRLLVDSEFTPAGGIIGAGFEELIWPRPVRPGDMLHLSIEVLGVRPSGSKPDRGMLRLRIVTLNQNDDPVQISVGTLVVQRNVSAPSH